VDPKKARFDLRVLTKVLTVALAFHRYQVVIDNIADKNRVAGLRAVAEAGADQADGRVGRGYVGGVELVRAVAWRRRARAAASSFSKCRCGDHHRDADHDRHGQRHVSPLARRHRARAEELAIGAMQTISKPPSTTQIANFASK
jgi:hypothetical protein